MRAIDSSHKIAPIGSKNKFPGLKKSHKCILFALVFLFKNQHIKDSPLYLLIIWVRANIDKQVDLALKNLYLKWKPPEISKSPETAF